MGDEDSENHPERHESASLPESRGQRRREDVRLLECEVVRTIERTYRREDMQARHGTPESDEPCSDSGQSRRDESVLMT